MFHFIDSLKKINLPFFSYFDVCLDLGTVHTRIGVKQKGVVLREATIIGVNTRSREYLFFGDEARKIRGKTPEFINIVKPITNGVITDFDSEVALINHFFEKSVAHYRRGKLINAPIRTITTVPTIATEIEQRAVEEVMGKIGSHQTILIEKPLAIAAGVGINVFSHQPHFIIDLGGGLIEMAIISGGGIVVKKTLKNAGEHMNHLINNYCYLKYGIILGENTVEELKKELLNFVDDERSTTVRGKSLENGLPKSVRIKSSEIKEALLNNLNQIIDAAKELIEQSPAEVVEELYTNGIFLSGEMTNCDGIDRFFSQELKIESVISPAATDAAIQGIMTICKNEEHLVKLSYTRN